MRRLTAILLLLCSAAWPACHVVGKSATGTCLASGTNCGTDWTSMAALGVTTGFTGSTFIAGDTYYLADTLNVTNTIAGVCTIDGTAKTITCASGSFIVQGVTTSHEISFINGFSAAENKGNWFPVTNVTATTLTLSDPNDYLATESSSSGATTYAAINPTPDAYPVMTVAKASTIRKARSGDHCTDTGWVVGTMGSSVAMFSGGTTRILNTSVPGAVIDGNGATDAVSGYGIVLNCTHMSNTSSVACAAPGSSGTYKYVEMFGLGKTDITNNRFMDAVVLTNTSNVLLDHVYMHSTSDCILTYSGASNVTLQYSVLSDDHSSANIHGGATCGNASSNTAPVVTNFKAYYNQFRNIQGTAYHDILSSSPVAPFSVTNVTVAANVLTINGGTFGGAPPAGRSFYLTGLTTATFLNGQTVAITSSTTTQIVAPFTHADYALTVDTGNVIPAMVGYELVGNTYSQTVPSLAPGNGLFGSLYLSPGAMATTGFKFDHNTVNSLSNAFFIIKPLNYVIGEMQNNMFINTTASLSLLNTGGTVTMTEDHNSAYCAGIASTCYPSNSGQTPSGFNGTGDEILNSTATPLTAGSFPTAQFVFNLTAHTTTGTAGSFAYTDPIGVVAPQGGIYDRGAYLFVTAGNQILTVTGLGTGNGTICSDGAACVDGIINCTITAGVASGTCTHTFTSGASVTLTETATSGGFGGWSGACGGNTSTCALTMNAPFTATGTFQIVPVCTLTLAANSLNSPATVSATTSLTGVSGVGSFWFVLDPLSANISLCSYPYGNCTAAGQSGNLPYTVSGLYSLGACSNGVCCTGSTQPLNINTGAGSAAH